MQLNRTENPVSRKERIKINENWDAIEQGVNDIIADINDHAEAIEDTHAVATEALTTANSANETANEAKLKAENAVEIANNASNVANKIDGKAQEALNKSNNAFIASNTALDIANQAKMTANTTAKQLNDVIEDSGNTNAEVISGRTNTISNETYTTFGERVDAEYKVTSESIARQKEVARKKNLRNIRPLFSFLCDDGYIEDYVKLKPITEQTGAPFSLAIITSVQNFLFGENNRWMLRELVDNYGYEVLSHTVNHPGDSGTNGALVQLSDEEIDYELRESKRQLEAAGFDVQGIVYPYGSNDARVRKIATKYYDCGYAAGTGKLNDSPLNTFAIERIQFDRKNPNNNLDHYKSLVDETIAKKKWCVFMVHTGDGLGDFDESQQQMCVDVINYIKSKNAEIVTCKDAFDEFRNMYEAADESMKIGAKLNNLKNGANLATDTKWVAYTASMSKNDNEVTASLTANQTGYARLTNQSTRNNHIKISKGEQYTISLLIKANRDITRNYLVSNLTTSAPLTTTQKVDITTTWQRVVFTFTALLDNAADTDFIMWIGNGDGTALGTDLTVSIKEFQIETGTVSDYKYNLSDLNNKITTASNEFKKHGLGIGANTFSGSVKDINTTGMYYATGGNTDLPSGFLGHIFAQIHSASYKTLLAVHAASGYSYRNTCNNGIWTGWRTQSETIIVNNIPTEDAPIGTQGIWGDRVFVRVTNGWKEMNFKES